MSDWITDRLPTEQDCQAGHDEVWVYDENYKIVVRISWQNVWRGQPWQPIPRPAPYVKPKRWTVEWDDNFAMWKVTSLIGDRRKVAASLWCLSSREDHANAAQRIADIYNEVLP